MSYKINFVKQPKYLHVIVTGKNSAEAVAAYMQDILQECRRQDCYYVLIDERLEGPRLATIDIFLVASEGAANALGIFRAIACVDESMDPAMSYFAETVAINRGLPVRVLPNIDEAEAWLVEQSRDAA